MWRQKLLVLKTQHPHNKIAGASLGLILTPCTGYPVAAGEHQVLFWDTSCGLASSKKLQFMLFKTTLRCELIKTLGPQWNLLQKTCSLSIVEHWCIDILSLPTHSFPAKPTQFPLLALHKVDVSPSSPSVYDSISYPDSLSNLSLLFLFSFVQCVQPVLHPPPTFSHLPFLHCIN